MVAMRVCIVMRLRKVFNRDPQRKDSQPTLRPLRGSWKKTLSCVASGSQVIAQRGMPGGRAGALTMGKRKWARPRRRRLPIGEYTIIVYGDTEARVIYDEVTGEAWSFCSMCKKTMPLDMKHAPSVQVCVDCVNRIE